MANTHGVVNTVHCACTNVDAYLFTGIAATDIDNGTFLKLGKIKTENGVITEYVFDVEVDANGAADQKYIANTPIPGSSTDLAIQVYDDPRHFYNEAGQPIQLERIINGDCVKFSLEHFGAGKAPTDQPTYTSASIGADGKLEMVSAAGEFELLGQDSIPVGQHDVPAWAFMYKGN